MRCVDGRTTRPAPYPCGGCEVVREARATRDGRVALAHADEPGARVVLDGPDNGVVRLVRTEDGWYGERDLILAP